MDGTAQRDLRPDKLAVMVTNIESQGDVENTWAGSSSSPSSSEERLTVDHATPSNQRKMEVGIHQTFEVTQTTLDGDVEERSYRMAREHV